MYNVEDRFKHMQEVQSHTGDSRAAFLCNQMQKNSHIHITVSLLPAVKQNPHYSISAFVIGPHLAISSVISLSGLITAAEELCSEKQSPDNRNTLPQLSIHPHPQCHYLCICTPWRSWAKTQRRPREDMYSSGAACGMVDLSFPTASKLGMASLHCKRQKWLLLPRNCMPIKSACKAHYQR